ARASASGISRSSSAARRKRGDQDGLPLRIAGTGKGPAPGCGQRPRSDLTGLAPAALVLLANDLRVRHGAHDRPDLDLLVALDGRLVRAAVLLAPHEDHLVADVDVRIDRAERQHRALVVAVAGE